MKKLIEKCKVSKQGAKVAASTVGIGGSIAFVLINVPSDLGWFTLPSGYIPHVTAIIIGVWNRTGSRWLLS